MLMTSNPAYAGQTKAVTERTERDAGEDSLRRLVPADYVSSGAGLLGLLLLLLAVLCGLLLLAGLGLGTGGLLVVLHGVITSFPVRAGHSFPADPRRSESSMAHPAPDYTHFFRLRVFLHVMSPSFSKIYTISLGPVV